MPALEIAKRRWVRFSLATFFFISLSIGTIIAGYQSGHRRGYNSGAAARYDETQTTESYSTVAIVWPDLPPSERETAFNNLKDLLQSSITPDIWNDARGNQIRPDPFGYGNMIVTAPGSTQKEIRDLLAQLERLSMQGGVQELLPAMQSLTSVGSAQGKSQDAVFPITPPKTRPDWIDKYFDLTADGIRKQWGTPRYQGKCTDAGFPAWSLDQRIVTWPRGGGLSYLALRRLDDGQLHIVAGWHKNS